MYLHSTTICILIPIHNRIELTKTGLNSIHKALEHFSSFCKSSLRFELIVIDDGSTDGSAEWIEMHYPSVKLLYGNGDLWWSGSLNVGISYALENPHCSHVIFWNDDTTCNLNYFCNLEKYLSESQFKEAILVSKIFMQGESNTLFNYGCIYNSQSGKSTMIGLNQKDTGEFEKPIIIDWSGGMGTTIPIKVFKEVGLLDNTNFPQYHGDKDFFLRAKKKGFVAYALPDLKIWNNTSSSGLSLVPPYTKSFMQCITGKRSQYNFKENFVFLRKHSPTAKALSLFLLFYLRFFCSYLKKML